MPVSFALRYTANELRRRRGRALLTALGLSAGVGLLIALVGVSQGLSSAQAKVLSPLSSVGADVLVTRVAGATTTTGTGASPSPTPSSGAGGQRGGFGGGGGGGFGGGGGGFFAGGAGGGAGALNQADVQALLQDNASLVTDLAKLGKPGTKFTRDFFLPATLLTFPQQAVSDVSKLPHVTSAVGALSLLATHQTGTVPTIVASLQTGGQTITKTQQPAPLSASERQAFQACIAKNSGGSSSSGRSSASPAPRRTGGGGGGGGGGFGGGGGGFGGGGFGRGEVEACLPARFREFRASFTVPLQTIRQVLNPPQTDITSTTYTAAGVDPAHPDQGPVTTAQLVGGSFLSATATDDVLVNIAYANSHSLKVGSTLPVNGTNYRVVGLVNPTLSGNTADLYFPLATMQKLSSQSQRINMVLVRADNANDVAAVAKEVQAALPGAQVVTTKALADQVSGSLSDAKKLTDRFGGALVAIVLLAAFAIAVLLTLGAVAKRVREIGTLRAIGWGRRRVVGQLLAETTGIGVVGAALGVALGAVIAVAVEHWAPALTANKPTVPGQGSSTLSRLLDVPGTSAGTTHVPLSVPLHPTTLLIGVALALLGGLLAGAVGGWRAARLAPAVALRDLG
ncbi:MAG TPA: FtsX-like permease family protein [Mycobacteriales bacterium]|nr:FtsX-like permease family protein [Mycobacteriales bacterium]